MDPDGCIQRENPLSEPESERFGGCQQMSSNCPGARRLSLSSDRGLEGCHSIVVIDARERFSFYQIEACFLKNGSSPNFAGRRTKRYDMTFGRETDPLLQRLSIYRKLDPERFDFSILLRLGFQVLHCLEPPGQMPPIQPCRNPHFPPAIAFRKDREKSWSECLFPD